MKDTKELGPVQVLREATIADLASEIGTARSVGGSAFDSGLVRSRGRPSPAAVRHLRGPEAAALATLS